MKLKLIDRKSIDNSQMK